MSAAPHLLFIDDEATLRGLMAERLTERGFEVVEADSGERALELLDQFAFDIVITDLRLPGIDGSRVIEAARERYPGIVAIVITGFGTVKDAVDAIKRGASDFIAKPFQFDELIHVLQKAMEQRRLTSENAYLRSQLEDGYRFGGADAPGGARILGRSRPMQKLFHLLETVARSSSTILITGETGTGKEVVARAIHHNSPRRSQRFVALNCSAIPETLLEAELFGHVRGAFTGAVGARQGRFEQAHKGTLFLDEVGTMSTALQMKLLRALQEREFERVGDSQTIKVDVRVIAATNSELSKMVAEGTFREDLYYRLHVIPIHLPPLRDRRDDIPVLVKHFLEKFAPGTAMQVSQGAMRALMAYQWPGNVRQLENAIERAVALSAGRKETAVVDLPAELQTTPETTETPFVDFPDSGLDLPAYLAKIERDLIERSLERTGGNRNKAAELLRIKRTTLVEKLRRLAPE
ncbi:MAG TPA: sigma-54 dependent transcriptional regulator [Vicinamibacterales bacterium]|jgi:DNA-binding NtrC family response regulator|nr:sigma-54 dependent transcriptional regulator [Vicinamibacterales bacterium]